MLLWDLETVSDQRRNVRKIGWLRRVEQDGLFVVIADEDVKEGSFCGGSW